MILQQLNGKSPLAQMLPIIKSAKAMLNSAQNPQAMINQIIQQNPKVNSIISQYGSVNGAINAICNQQGISVDEFMEALK